METNILIKSKQEFLETEFKGVNKMSTILNILKHKKQYSLDEIKEQIIFNKAMMNILKDYIVMNKSEEKLQYLIERVTDKFVFTGERCTENRIGTKYPDFINYESRQIIELHGDYWHNLPNQEWHRSEEGTIFYYNQYKYDTLVIWESELKDEDLVLSRIKEFINK